MKRILLVMLLIVCWTAPGASAELFWLEKGTPAPDKGILLDVPTSFRVLEVLEDYPLLKEEKRILEQRVVLQEAMEEVRKERELLYAERISALEKQNEEWRRLYESSLQLAERAQQQRGSWYDRLTHDAGVMLLGGVIAAGFVALAAF